jgi:uncharacterized protein YodC (DUF2158 family)
MDDLKAGDVVNVITGGPRMTIEVVGKLVSCVWFDGTALHKKDFHPETLKKSI